MNRLLVGIILGIALGSVATSVAFGPSIELVKEARAVINYCKEFSKAEECWLIAVPKDK